MELIIIAMERNMLVNEKMINSMEKDKRFGQMEQNIQVTMLMEKKKDMEFFCELMGQIMTASSFKIAYMDQENILGLMADLLSVIGNTIKWMEKAFLNGPMVGNMRVSTLRIKNKGMAFSSGQMAVNTMDNG